MKIWNFYLSFCLWLCWSHTEITFLPTVFSVALQFSLRYSLHRYLTIFPAPTDTRLKTFFSWIRRPRRSYLRLGSSAAGSETGLKEVCLQIRARRKVFIDSRKVICGCGGQKSTSGASRASSTSPGISLLSIQGTCRSSWKSDRGWTSERNAGSGRSSGPNRWKNN